MRSDTWKTTFSGGFLLILIVSVIRKRTAIYIVNRWFWEGFSKQRVTSKQQLLEHDLLHRINLQKARVVPLQVWVLPGVQWVLNSITPDALVTSLVTRTDVHRSDLLSPFVVWHATRDALCLLWTSSQFIKNSQIWSLLLLGEIIFTF